MLRSMLEFLTVTGMISPVIEWGFPKMNTHWLCKELHAFPRCDDTIA